jgi:hypothetical protein
MVMACFFLFLDAFSGLAWPQKIMRTRHQNARYLRVDAT